MLFPNPAKRPFLLQCIVSKPLVCDLGKGKKSHLGLPFKEGVNILGKNERRYLYGVQEKQLFTEWGKRSFESPINTCPSGDVSPQTLLFSPLLWLHPHTLTPRAGSG